MTTLKNNNFYNVLHERKAIKKYDSSYKISKDEMSEIIALASKAPSSVNMQPWRFIVVESETAKEKLVTLSPFNKEKIESSSAVIAIFADKDYFSFAEEIFSQSVKLGYMPQEVKETQLNTFKPYQATLSDQQIRETIILDAGLVSMQLMLVARAYGYDTNPMGGYDKENIAEALNLDKERCIPVMLLSIGKAKTQGFNSYRLPVKTTTDWI